MAIISDDAEINAIRLKEQGSDPATPASTYGKLYIKADGVYFIDDAGVVTGPLIDAGSSADPDAIHDNVAGEISAITEKTTPVGDDLLLIEDSAAINAKKKLKLSNASKGLGLVSTITFIVDGGGSAIATGIKGDLQIDFACTINAVTLLADQSGSIVVDIWKDTYANYPPTDADSITASATPTISSATKAQDTTLTGWTTSIAAGDILRFNVDSATTVTRVLVALKVTRT